MKFALSTNWCNRRFENGEEIADKALELGFEELELGFHTSIMQVAGFKRCLDRIPVGSVHAFCPVPISAPQGYPELYQLASFDAESRKMANLQIKRNIDFAADIGARTVVLHAGRVMCDCWFASRRMKKRYARGRKMTDILKKELDALAETLEKRNVVLALENLPYVEGFPDEIEITSVCGEWVKPWMDTGHDYVRIVNGWKRADIAQPWGFHISDSQGNDDHLPPGEGRVNFASFIPAMRTAKHLVFEPNAGVNESRLKRGVAVIKALFENEKKLENGAQQ